MIDATFRPLGADWVWEPTKTRARTFTASWSDTLGLLDRELRAVAARAVVVQIDLRESQLRADGWPRADARAPDFPGVILSFDSRYGPLRYATDREERGGWVRQGTPLLGWQANLRAIGLGLEALRKIERYGITRTGEQYRGWSALPAATAMGAPLTPEQALDIVSDLADAERTTVSFANWRDVYRRAALVTHPDQGGNPEAWAALDRARRTLEDGRG